MKTFSITIFFLVTLLVYQSCTKMDNSKEDIEEMNVITTDWAQLTKKVITKGDTNAYYELFYYFIEGQDSERIDSVMYYSRIMAEKYNYRRAGYDYVNALEEKYRVDLYRKYSKADVTKMRKKEKKMIALILKRGFITKNDCDSIHYPAVSRLL